MKKNLPVTQKRIELSPEAILVSHTDLKGIITWANREFAEASGFSCSELMGSNHNMVRYPDVPPVLFKDLWATVQRGDPWSGYVKNRAKNGDHYWVEANVAPRFEKGEIVGYLSVRRALTLEQIREAEALYDAVNRGKVAVMAGVVHQGVSGWFSRLIRPFTNRSVLVKQTSMVLLLVALPLLLFGWVAVDKSRIALQQQVFSGLEAIAANKGSAVERYFQQIQDQVRTLAENRMVVDAMDRFPGLFASYRDDLGADDAQLMQMRQHVSGYYRNAFGKEYEAQNRGKTVAVDHLFTALDDETMLFQHQLISANPHPLGSKDELDVPGGGGYSEFHAEIHPIVRNYLKTFGYYDIFLVSNRGKIVYSVFKELDYATSLIDGPYAETGIAEVYRQARDLPAGGVAFSDFRQYLPSYDTPASFIATPIHDAQGEPLGVLIFQMPLDRISAVMKDRAGLGESGESYLVGADRLMRSDGYHGEDHTVINSFRYPDQGRIEGEAVEQALQGRSGVVTANDYRGDRVLSAYRPVTIFDGLNWALEVKVDRDEAFAELEEMNRLLLLFGGAVLLVVLVLGGVSARHVAHSMRRVVVLLSRMREGILDNRIRPDGQDEIQQMLAALQITQVKLSADLDLIGTQAAESTRIKVALDNASTGVMVADIERRIIYMNRALERLLRRNEAALQQALPHFRVDEVVGQSMDVFHRNPQHQADLLDGLTELYEAEIVISGRTFVLKASPVIDSDGVRQGTAMEWSDISESVAAQQQVNNLVQGAAAGELDRRLDTSDFSGFIRMLGDGINQMLDAIEAPLGEVMRVLEAQAKGDLSSNMSGRYSGQFETLQSHLNEMNSSLKEVISEVVSRSGTISHAAAQISQGSTDLSQRTQEQAASVEETAASMEEMTSTVEQNSNNSEEANKLSQQARQVAEEGSEVMRSAVVSMQEMHQASARIADIIATIDGISFQTNLLALNAAVEAARAGDHGRGFAVVAGEVRSLAQRSADAAKEIKLLIEDSIAKIERGTSQVDQAGESLDRIVSAVQQVSSIVSEITMASLEQKEGIGQVNRAVGELDRATQQNAALVEETAASSEDMNNQAQALRERMGYFKV